jgi:predicted Zn-dependent protease
MQKRLNKGFFVLLAVLLVSCGSGVYAQATTANARQLATDKKYDKAIVLYTEIYGLSPDSVYTEYLNMLLVSKKFKQAEQLVQKQMTLRDNPFLQIDLGLVYDADGNKDKAKEQYAKVLKMINGDILVTERVAKAFAIVNKDDYAVQAYEQGGNLIGAPYYFKIPLAILHAKNSNYDKAIDVLLIPIPNMGLNLEEVKNLLLELLGTDQTKMQQVQKTLIKKINEHPENVYYVELLTWIFTQKNDWEGALIQMEAIDERNKENGHRLMDLARNANNAKQYDVAERAYDDIIVKGRESPYYFLSRSERLATGLNRIKNSAENKPEAINSLAAMYDSFFVEFPKHYGMQSASDFALLLAQYADNVPKAITVLKKGINEPDAKRDMVGRFKLQLGDYYVLIGKVWEASLTYSQVDKDFKQDAIAEDARFRNAKLAYYRGDFDWAQKQLDILKHATSQLIANDAIYLSVLITENVADSDLVPLQRFAYAGLLLFQNKDAEAEALLDSINKAYPEHPLNDDILMTRADMARKRLQFEKALDYLKNIKDKYGEDVLGDDAVFKTAEIYQNDLHKNDEAKKYYEQLIIDYIGSTYVQVARQRLNEMNGVLP